MENTLFIIMLAVFASIDGYKMIIDKVNFYSFYKPLVLMVIYKFIFANISLNAFYVALFYMLINYLFILKHLNTREVKYE